MKRAISKVISFGMEMEERRTDVLNDGIVGGGGVVANSVDVLKRLLILRVNLVVRLVVFVQESMR